jgi:putative ABC transport system ATP-binding protein
MKGISKIFRTDLVETHALKDLNLHVEAGELVAVTGPSGSGKTTFLNIAGLLDESTHGEYVLDGEDVSRLSDDERSRFRNEKVGFIFQNFNLIPDLSVYDNVEVPLCYRRIPAAERRKRINATLGLVGLEARAAHLPAQLSGGQQQRVAIARALAGSPRVILADEPTGNLDTDMSSQIMSLIEEINRSGTTVIIVTHNRELAQRARRHVQLTDGVVVAGE